MPHILPLHEGRKHLTQSYYAYDFLTNAIGLSKNVVIPVTDYLNDSYLEEYDESKYTRNKVVLYNPVKGYDVTRILKEDLPDIKFVPIENMSVNEVRELLRSSILYIDFGRFPGKDRIPREAVISGCCIITSDSGAANYKQDVNIPNKLKYNTVLTKDRLQSICILIRDILDNYDKYKPLYNDYRNDIRKEHENFVKGVDILVKRLGE